jgi:DNA-binding PadR family transcriptional regulator
MAASELVRRMATGSPSFYIPRAESMVYAEVRELAARRLARTRPDRSTRRARTLYAITPAGREALDAHLRQPASGIFRLDWPALLKVAFGHLTDKRVVRAHLDALERELAEHCAGAVAPVVAAWAERGFEFPERAHLSLLIGDLHVRLADTIQSWLAEARERVERAPSVRTRPGEIAALRALAAQRYERITVREEPHGAARPTQRGSAKRSRSEQPRHRRRPVAPQRQR